MPRYVAFLRGVMPQNLKMPDLRACLESAGFGNVRTVLASGNVAFDSPLLDEAEVEHVVEAAMTRALGRIFYPIVRRSAVLATLLDGDVYAEHGIPADARRVICFFRAPPMPRLPLPLAEDLASVFLVRGREAYAAYRPSPKGPVFMTLIQRAFGQQVTTRTVDTIARCARA